MGACRPRQSACPASLRSPATRQHVENLTKTGNSSLDGAGGLPTYSGARDTANLEIEHMLGNDANVIAQLIPNPALRGRLGELNKHVFTTGV